MFSRGDKVTDMGGNIYTVLEVSNNLDDLRKYDSDRRLDKFEKLFEEGDIIGVAVLDEGSGATFVFDAEDLKLFEPDKGDFENMLKVRSVKLVRRPKQADDVLQEKAKYYKISEMSNDYLYVECRALTVGIPNANGDLFVMPELKKIHQASGEPVYRTFVGRGVYINHNSDNPQNSIGLVFDAELVEDEEDPHVRLLVGIDKKKAPEIVEGIKRGTINSFSMGCSIRYSTCTYCGKKILSDDDLCDCLRYHRGEKIGSVIVAEELHDIEFYEISVVSVPADYRARLINVLGHSEKRLKVAAIDSFTLVSWLTEKVFSRNICEKQNLLVELQRCEDGQCRLY